MIPSTRRSVRWLPPSTRPNSLDYGLQVRTIMASKCIFPNSLDHSLQVYLQTGWITASNFARSWPPSASTHSLDHGLQVHLQTHLITAFKCISKLAWLRPPSSLDNGLQVHLQTHPITASECISEFTRSSFSGAPRIALKHCLQPVQIYRV